MPRQPRVHDPGAYVHITARANDTAALFVDDEDRRRFLGMLSDVTYRTQWRLLAFCLMSTHYHLLVQEGDVPLAKPMHLLHSRYVRWFAQRHDHRGHVFGGRYRVARIGPGGHLLNALRYIARNPVEAGLCATPLDWQWSSYRGLAGLAQPLSFVSTAHTLSLFDADRSRAARLLRQFVEQVPGTEVPGTGGQAGCEASLNSRNSPVTR